MAYISQDEKKAKAPAIKAVLKKYGVKGTLGIRHYSTLVLNISEGAIDFIKNYNEVGNNNRYIHNGRFQLAENCLDVNPYWYHEHFSGVAKDFLGEVLQAMNQGNHDNSRPEIDHFDVGFYIDVNIGQWDKPYKVIQ